MQVCFIKFGKFSGEERLHVHASFSDKAIDVFSKLEPVSHEFVLNAFCFSF